MNGIMKRFFVACLTLIFAQAIDAQIVTSGSLESLKGVTRFSFQMDYSSVSICGLSEEDFLDWHLSGKDEAEDAEWREKWNGEIKNDFAQTFIEDFTGTQEDLPRKQVLLLRPKKPVDYKMVVCLKTINNNYDVTADVKIIGPSGEEVAVISARGRSVPFGSFEFRTRKAIGRVADRVAELFGENL